jgi:hypothetical protein
VGRIIKTQVPLYLIDEKVELLRKEPKQDQLTTKQSRT